MGESHPEILCVRCGHGVWHHGRGGLLWTPACRWRQGRPVDYESQDVGYGKPQVCTCPEFVPPPRVFEYPADAPWYVAVFHCDGTGPCAHPRGATAEEAKEDARALYDSHPMKKSFIACSVPYRGYLVTRASVGFGRFPWDHPIFSARAFSCEMPDEMKEALASLEWQNREKE